MPQAAIREQGLGRKPAAAAVIWGRLGVSGQRGRMAVGEYPTRHSVACVFALGNLSARFSLTAVTSTANCKRWLKASIGRERAHTGTECITQLNDEHT